MLGVINIVNSTQANALTLYYIYIVLQAYALTITVFLYI